MQMISWLKHNALLFAVITTALLLFIHVTNLSVFADDVKSTSEFLFRFKVPVNISNTGELELRTNSSEIKVQCDVLSSSNQVNVTGFKIIELKNHKYNGTLTIDANNRSGNQPLHLMSTYRCTLLARGRNPTGEVGGPFSETSIKEYAAAGSKTVITGKLQ